jgi:hypothetical protein
MVSPSTLLAALRTIASVWKNENQTRNAVEIGKKAGEMLDKFMPSPKTWMVLARLLKKRLMHIATQ